MRQQLDKEETIRLLYLWGFDQHQIIAMMRGCGTSYSLQTIEAVVGWRKPAIAPKSLYRVAFQQLTTLHPGMSLLQFDQALGHTHAKPPRAHLLPVVALRAFVGFAALEFAAQGIEIGFRMRTGHFDSRVCDLFLRHFLDAVAEDKTNIDSATDFVREMALFVHNVETSGEKA